MLLNSIYFVLASNKIIDTLINEKYIETVHHIEMLASAVEANNERESEDHELSIINSIEYLDRLEQIYGAVYKYVDNEPILISNRYFETSIFNPFDYDEFVNNLRKNSEHISIGYVPEEQTYRDLKLYFRWMPLYAPLEQRYLVVGGISHYSMVSEIPLWVSVGQWMSIMLTLFLNFWFMRTVLRIESEYGRCLQ